MRERKKPIDNKDVRAEYGDFIRGEFCGDCWEGAAVSRHKG